MDGLKVCRGDGIDGSHAKIAFTEAMCPLCEAIGLRAHVEGKCKALRLALDQFLSKELLG